MAKQPDVRVGQVWEDADPRNAGRRLRVEELVSRKRTGRRDANYGREETVPAARCVILANREVVQREIDRQRHPYFRDQRGRSVVIALDRFRPTSTGYRLVEDASSVETR